MKDSINHLETNLIKMQNKFKSDIEMEMIGEQQRASIGLIEVKAAMSE